MPTAPFDGRESLDLLTLTEAAEILPLPRQHCAIGVTSERGPGAYDWGGECCTGGGI
jgi:hypothetical protein